MTISALILQWNDKKLGTVAFDQSVVFDFNLAVGECSQKRTSEPKKKGRNEILYSN